MTMSQPDDLVAASKCWWQTAYGMPWDRYCGANVNVPGELCTEHKQEFIDNYGPRGWEVPVYESQLGK